MEARLETCCCLFSTRTGSLVIGIINLFGSFVCTVMMASFLILLLVADYSIANRPSFTVVYVMLSIGILAAVLQFITALLLVRGVQRKSLKLIRSYLIFGSITMAMSLISIAVGALGLTSVITALLGAVVQIYFLFVIYSEYKRIQDETS